MYWSIPNHAWIIVCSPVQIIYHVSFFASSLIGIAPKLVSDWFTALNDKQRQNARRKFQEACVVGLQTVVNDQPIEEAEEVDAAELTGDTTESAGDTIANPNQKL